MMKNQSPIADWTILVEKNHAKSDPLKVWNARELSLFPMPAIFSQFVFSFSAYLSILISKVGEIYYQPLGLIRMKKATLLKYTNGDE